MGIKIIVNDYLDKLEAEHGMLVKELVKQSIDQPLHILMAVASVWIIGYLTIALAGQPVVWAVTFSGVLTGAWMAFREYRQWPSNRWWDPPMDWVFEAGGLALGIWSFLNILG